MKETPARARGMRVQDEPLTRRQIVSRIILGVVALALLAGMVAQFTPNLGQGNTANQGTTVLSVNGKPVTDRELEQLRQRTAAFQLNVGGVVGQDLNNLLIDQAVLLQAVQQDAGRIRVSGGDVKANLDQIRASNNLQDNKDYLAALQRLGYTDATFREEVKKSIQIQRRIEELQAGAKVGDEEARFYFENHRNNYVNDPRIVARQVVVADKKVADDVRDRAAKGEDFAALAKQHSTVGKDQGGALGAKSGESTPQPVTRITLPTAVADEAFKLTDGGVTPVVSEGGKFYVVKVEKFLPGGQQSFDEAKTKVEADVKQLAQGQAIEAWVEGLRRNAKVEIAEGSNLEFYNPAVAKVADYEVLLADLNRSVYFNEQVAQFLQQGGEEGGALVLGLFKPQALDSLINQQVAVKAARDSGKPFIGDRSTLLGEVQAWAARDVKVSEADARKYYQDNLASAYTTPASASVVQANFTTAAAARSFRASFLKDPKDFSKAVEAAKGTANDLGNVTAGTLDPAFSKAVFEARALTRAGDGQVTDVLQQDKNFSVLYVTNLSDEQVQSFAEARQDATNNALAAKKAEAGQKWLTDQREKTEVANFLEKVNKELEAKAKKADAKNTAPATGTTGTAGSTGTTGTTTGEPENK
ncbi:MAG TPA: peptidyl-prolyl cis-trans isomerase [Deinococcales bacterium]|nr:peptidyl-prolyl cis-trans isomerase [Deinococcales bacterium]